MWPEKTLENNQLKGPLAGLGYAIAIAICWLGSLILLPYFDTELPPVGWGLVILVRAFLQTGLFITAHDAMHGSLLPSNPRINHLVGRLALLLYAVLPYQRCRINHHQHHRYPGQALDPDCCDSIYEHPVSWYFKFIREYSSVQQFVVLVSGWGLLFYGLNRVASVSISSFFLLWIAPLILSSVQLFLFGTYLPHHYRSTEPSNIHCAYSTDYGLLWSLISCYHFGYHWEHHEYPQVPWYGLPATRFQHRQLSYQNANE